uniref:GA-binding protein subunit beta-1-like n=1 Tax=Styela clava TaxID=7725 RepID=UPI00193A62BE|nr:GA-binding protein subunit beta-1-like [Styela clava]
MDTSTSFDPPLTDLGKNLLEAARYGDEEKVRTLLTKGASFTTDWLGTSPLHLAAQNGHQNTALLLMRAGMSCNARSKVDKTPLHLATQSGHIGLVEALIKHGAGINALDMLKMTPLHWASVKNHKEVALCLLQNGADRTLKSKFDKTALDICMEESHFALADILKGVHKRRTTPETNSKTFEKSSVVVPNLSQATEPIQTNLLASLSALAGMSGEMANSVVTLDELSRLRSSPVSLPPNPLDNVRSFILTDAGKLAMQFWNKTWESEPVTINHKSNKQSKLEGSLNSVLLKSKCKNNSKSSPYIEKEAMSLVESCSNFSESVITEQEDSSPCSKDVSDLLVIPSSSVGSLPFSNIFSDCGNNNINNRSNSESDDACALDLERDILERQLENAKRAASRFREESLRKETEAERYRLQLEMLCKRQSKSNVCKNT